MTNHDRARKPATLDDVRGLGTIPVWSPTKPDAADVLGISRALAYGMAQRGDLPVIRLGSRVVVPIPALLRMLGEGHLINAPPSETEDDAEDDDDDDEQLTQHQMLHAGNGAMLTAAGLELSPRGPP